MAVFYKNKKVIPMFTQIYGTEFDYLKNKKVLVDEVMKHTKSYENGIETEHMQLKFDYPLTKITKVENSAEPTFIMEQCDGVDKCSCGKIKMTHKKECVSCMSKIKPCNLLLRNSATMLEITSGSTSSANGVNVSHGGAKFDETFFNKPVYIIRADGVTEFDFDLKGSEIECSNSDLRCLLEKFSSLKVEIRPNGTKKCVFTITDLPAKSDVVPAMALPAESVLSKQFMDKLNALNENTEKEKAKPVGFGIKKC